jgi:hypothetical protein
MRTFSPSLVELLNALTANSTSQAALWTSIEQFMVVFSWLKMQGRVLFKRHHSLIHLL